MLNAYLYLFYPILLHLARGFGKKDDENDKKCGIKPLKALPLGEAFVQGHFAASSYILFITCASSACVPALSQMMTGASLRSASSSIRGCGSGPN